MVRLVKQCLHKTTGKAKLTTKQELEEVILDTEINLTIDRKNNNIIIIPEEQFDDDDKTIKKRQKYIKRCKDAAWNRWNKVYLSSLRERDNMKYNQKHMEIAIGDVVLIKGDDKHRGKWNIGIVEELFEGKDNVIRAVKLRSRKTHIERPVQFLYPLELSCDTWKR